MDTKMVNQRDAARRLGVSTAALRKWRQKGVGPTPWIKVNQILVLYEERGLVAWLDARRKSA